MAPHSTKIQELRTFLKDLRTYSKYRLVSETGRLSTTELERASKLRVALEYRVGGLKPLIKQLTGLEVVPILRGGREYLTDIWIVGLRTKFNWRTREALGYCVSATRQAIGGLKSDIQMGKRDEQGNLAEKPYIIHAEPPKAFIAHGGDSPALRKLKSFLEALGVQPLIVEEQPSEGRSVGENVDWYARKADCAIILATKGDIDGKTGRFIPRGNVLIEIGKSQELFKDRIIYLLQAGTKSPTNISEKVWGRFTTQRMDDAFIKIAKELNKFGILKAVKPHKEE